VKDYKTGKVGVECTSVDIGCSNRIPPLNGRKTLETGENFTWCLGQLISSDEWTISNSESTSRDISDTNLVIERISGSQLMEEEEEEETIEIIEAARKRNRENIDDIPSSKKAKTIDADLYNSMVLKASQLKQNCAQLRLQLKEKDHEIYCLQTLQTRYNEVSITIYQLHKLNFSLEKPNENNKQMKPPYKIVFRRKEFFMDYNMY
jgi:DNA mismatch repair ATPase MutS